MAAIIHLEAEQTVYPMKSPFESAKRRSTEAENVLITITLDNGVTGYGEASPADYVTGETPAGVLAAAQEVPDLLRGLDAGRTELWCRRLQALDAHPTLRSGVEMALLDAQARTLGIPLWQHFGGAAPECRTDLTIPIAPPELAGQLAGEAASFGYRSLKIKVGGPDREEDFERVRRVSGAAPGRGIRLDANQAFAPDEAVAFVERCLQAGVPVELMEQPTPAKDWDALAAVTRRCPVPVMADEAVVNARDALYVASTGAAHGINIKLAKAGLIGALQIIAIARAGGLKLMLGCMLESLLGIGAAAHLACGTGAFDFLDLDSHALIGLKPTGLPFSQDGDVLRLSETTPGIGWTPEVGK